MYMLMCKAERLKETKNAENNSKYGTRSTVACYQEEEG
jgi:hypothetical protein